MKKIKLEKKLSLSKETIAKLNNDQLTVIKGGGTIGSCLCQTDYATCLCTNQPGGCPAFTYTPTCP